METDKFCQILAKEITKNSISNVDELLLFRNKISSKYKQKELPSLIQILLYLKEKDRKRFKVKPTRTMSGVTPVAIMTKPIPCPHGKCIYCPGGLNSHFGDVPQSYTGKEPATMRAIRNHYDPYLQIFNRLEHYVLLGHSINKIELIIMGGTFPSFEKKYQEDFVKYSFKAMNDFSDLFFNKKGELNYNKFKKFFELPTKDFQDKKRTEIIQNKLLKLKLNCDLEKEQTKNETANIRCIALCIETKPDWGLLKQGDELLRLGCTRIELGIQSVYEDVIKHIHRGHTIKDTIDSIRILKDLGFKISVHYMPGLPLTDKKRDIEGMKTLFLNKDYCPDMLKIYPTMVSKGTALYADYLQGKFKPIGAKEAAERIVEFKKFVPEYCRIQRIQRDVPTKQWEAGVELTNFRQFMFQNYKVECRCIRCREPREKNINWEKIKLKVLEYEASKGKEFFISAEDIENDLIIGFVRMRFPSECLRKEITKDSAMIRELHVYGTATGIGEEGLVQHKGWGKKLMQEAEKIAKKNDKNKMLVISGIGVRQYYYKIGYKKEGPYVVKEL
ncbi:tRNA uridine(34) 5-carboxymethylaminomethyl modification radical SAM/GNAT enzyme Elp3 [Candidatus Woesearchaeota archaeon]|nr:tRNA uridine(34) 5-carboxymethylaminomethyl modification radical SAM/GNAT enzyme Elp3 [Candidatus Woesearchaeota archaeon]